MNSLHIEKKGSDVLFLCNLLFVLLTFILCLFIQPNNNLILCFLLIINITIYFVLSTSISHIIFKDTYNKRCSYFSFIFIVSNLLHIILVLSDIRFNQPILTLIYFKPFIMFLIIVRLFFKTNNLNTCCIILFFLLIVNELTMFSNVITGYTTSTFLTLLFLYYMIFIFIKDKAINEAFKKQQLYKLNSTVLNEHLKFRKLEVDSLIDVSHKKDTLYKKIFDCSPDALLVVHDDIIVYSNRSALKLLDTNSLENLLNKPIWTFVNWTCKEKLQCNNEDLFRPKQSIISTDIKMLTCTKKVKDVRISSTSATFDGSSYIIYSIHDLSTMKKQKKIQVELENDIAKEKFKVEFFANISHDLKTPINVIYSATQLQDMYTIANEYDKVHMYNQVIKQNCLRLQKLLNDLLDITKIDSNYFKPKLSFCNIICTIEHITQSVTSYLAHKDISIIFDTNVEEKFSVTDVDLIERILLNLISNAIKYGKEKGSVWVTLFDEGEHLIISVKDNGIGIPKEQLDNIFDRFIKVSNNQDESISGNGIGLSLVKALVDLLDGEIFCLSTLGVGSEFVVILPMESQERKYTCNHDSIDSNMESKLIIELSDI